MKQHLVRTCEGLVVSKMKKPIFEKSSIYQIGGQARHSTDEHLFTLKSIMGLMEYLGEGFILTLLDIIAFFDREDIMDIMETLETMKINKKACRLWYKLNDSTQIQVKTVVDMSGTAEVGVLVGQGSGGAAVCSQAMVDNGLKQYFHESREEFY